MQRDSSTYCDEPEDGEAFEAWLAGFDLAGRRPDIERLIAENTFMSELQVRRVLDWFCGRVQAARRAASQLPSWLQVC